MKKERNVWAITSLIAFWWLAPNQINAQKDSTSLTTLDEVTVTATKFAKSQSETGKVLTIIDESQIRQSSGKDLSQLLNEQVGLYVNGANSNPGKDKSVYLRGAKSEYTIILLDGVPLNDPSSIGGGAYDLRLIPLDQVERIEILKGNQSTLYGSNAIAGVINIITKKEGDKPIRGNGTVGYGSFNTLKTSANISGTTAKLDYLIGVSRLSTHGTSEAKDTLNSRFENDGFAQKSFNTSITIKPIKALQLQPYFRYSDFDGNYDGGPFTDNPVNTYTSSLRNAGATVRYHLSKVNFHLYYGFDKSNRVFLDSAFGYTSTYTYSYKGKFHHGEAFLNYDIGKNIQLVGGYAFQSWLMQDAGAVIPYPSVTVASPYVAFFLRNLNGFSVELGGRTNHHSLYGNNFTYSFNPSYLHKNSFKVFVNASSGFKAPSLLQLYGSFGAKLNLKPETSQSFEGGVQFFIKAKTVFRVVGFQRKIKDIIFYSYPNGYLNLNEQKDKGVEFEASHVFNSKLKTKAFYSFVTGSLVTNTLFDKRNLYRIPKHSAGLNLQYQLLLSWLMSANYRFTGSRTDLFFNNETFASGEVKLKAYHLLDFYTEYALAKRRLKIFIDVKNLLNQHYYEVYGYSVLPITLQSGVSITL